MDSLQLDKRDMISEVLIMVISGFGIVVGSMVIIGYLGHKFNF